MIKKFLLVFAGLLLLTFESAIAQQQDLRPPAYPLITSDPYLSVWAMQDTLYNQPTRHWTEEPQSLLGLIRVDGNTMKFMGERLPEYKTVLPVVGDQKTWRYTFDKPGEHWQQNAFSAESWKKARGAFSNLGNTPNKWDSENIWVRRTFNIAALDSIDRERLELFMYHDDNVEVYLNGVLAYEKTGWVDQYEHFPILPKARRALREGENVLAIHCENTAGGAFIDAGLVEKQEPKERLHTVRQTDVEISATQTTYMFDAGPVSLETTFTTPFLPKKLELISRPAHYLTFKVRAKDGQDHRVQLFLSAGSDMAVNTTDQQVVWQRIPSRDLNIMRTGTSKQQILGKKGDNVRIDWGYLYLAAPQRNGTSTRISAAEKLISDFSEDGALESAETDRMPREVRSNMSALSTAFDFGKVGSETVSRHAIIAYDELFSVEYFHQPLQALWKKDGASVVDMLEQSEDDYDKLMRETARFDRQLFNDAVEAGGRKYAELAELAYRQSIAAHVLVEGPSGQPLFFSKENFSNGSIGTVDVTYPSSPLFLYYNPTLLKGMLEPIFYYTESGKWTKPFPAHDVGTYPIANGQTYPEDMPVEEAGNMLILSAAISEAEGNADFAQKHWEALTQWADYLMQNGLDPKNQLSTDDFAGHLAHNANLSIKAIMGIAGYGKMAGMMGKNKLKKKYLSTARSMAQKWIKMDDAGDHYSLTFDRPDTWSQKYNLVWDHVLDLNVFPDEVNKTEVQYYLDQQNKYGLPLDNRADYTKSDWIVWTATLAENKSTFQKFIAPMYRAFNETGDRVPMTDWYNTKDASQVGFQARSVVGGYFMKMLEQKFEHK